MKKTNKKYTKPLGVVLKTVTTKDKVVSTTWFTKEGWKLFCTLKEK